MQMIVMPVVKAMVLAMIPYPARLPLWGVPVLWVVLLRTRTVADHRDHDSDGSSEWLRQDYGNTDGGGDSDAD
jgi:hypothetical protein